jgi:hypothetical protein
MTHVAMCLQRLHVGIHMCAVCTSQLTYMTGSLNTSCVSTATRYGAANAMDMAHTSINEPPDMRAQSAFTSIDFCAHACLRQCAPSMYTFVMQYNREKAIAASVRLDRNVLSACNEPTSLHIHRGYGQNVYMSR